MVLIEESDLPSHTGHSRAITYQPFVMSLDLGTIERPGPVSKFSVSWSYTTQFFNQMMQ